MPRDPENADSETIRWEMDPNADFRTKLDGPGDVRAFTCGFIIRGFDVDEGIPHDVSKPVDEAELQTEALPPGELQ